VSFEPLPTDADANPPPSPEDRAHRINILRTAEKMWSARSSASSDARHAAKVLRAILVRVDTPKCSSKGSSLAASESTLEIATPNNSTPFPLQPPTADLMMAQPYVGDDHINFDDLLPIDSFFSTTEGLDWVRTCQARELL
jgi:hypothetical protein